MSTGDPILDRLIALGPISTAQAFAVHSFDGQRFVMNPSRNGRDATWTTARISAWLTESLVEARIVAMHEGATVVDIDTMREVWS